MGGERSYLKVKLQVMCGDEIAMGPGKADLLDAIAAHGSISAAARAIGMSYRRAWMLVDVMNRCWLEPIVETAPGGKTRAGARLTEFGNDVLDDYRRLEQSAFALQSGKNWQDMRARLRDTPNRQ